MILGIETATQVCGIAVCQQGRLIGDYRLNIKNAHAGVLVKSVQRLLADSRLQPSDLDAIAVSIGPGSFTGLRIGLATAKGLAFAGRQPVIPVPTLDAMAVQAPVATGLIGVLLRSRNKEYYAALYERVDFVDRIVRSPQVIAEEELAGFLPPEALLVIDPACGTPACINPITPAHFVYPSAFSVARLGEAKWRQGSYADSDLLEPDYLQDFITGQPKAGLN